MPQPSRTIAVLVANPALSAILCMVLAGAPSFRIRAFESELALLTYMRLVPIDLLVTDFDAESFFAEELVRELRESRVVANTDFDVIALASRIGAETAALCKSARIDEVLVKPMSPRLLLERAEARLRSRSPRPPERVGRPDQGLRQRPLTSRLDNVVPLFGPRPLPQG